MAGTTTNLALPYPSSTDPDNVPGDMQNLATAVEGLLIPQGLYANRPAPGHRGAWYFSTDKEWVSRDDGTAWHDFQSVADANAAYQKLSGPQHAYVTTAETTTSTAFTDLATVGPTVTVVVGPSGRVKVTLGAVLLNSNAGAETYMHVALTGANTRSAANNDSENFTYNSSAAGAAFRGSRTFVIAGLATGSTTFTAKYRATAGTSTIGGRLLLVEPV